VPSPVYQIKGNERRRLIVPQNSAHLPEALYATKAGDMVFLVMQAGSRGAEAERAANKLDPHLKLTIHYC